MQSTQKKFAEGLSFYKLVWIFIIGAIAGCLLETVWYFSQNGYYVSRTGVFYGPFSPIYGFGALLLTVSLYRIRDKNASFIFVISGLIGSTFEFICSYLQEMIMGTRSWNYSNTALNIQGRTNLQFTLIWGFLGLMFIKHTYPFCSELIEKAPVHIATLVTRLLVVFLIFDMAISVIGCARQRDRRNNIPSTNVFTQFLDQQYPDEYIDRIYTRVKIVQ